MIEAVKIWSEPNNLSQWDFHMDPDWAQFAATAKSAARALKQECPDIPLIMGGMSPIDPKFVRLMESHGLLEYMDALGVHGFPLDWNHWKLDDWPKKINEIREVSNLPIWVTEAGVSSFGAEEIQEFGMKRIAELLLNEVDHVFWYSLLDLPPAWQATTRHKENEDSSYYRHFYQGLVRADGTPKSAYHQFDNRMGICQWFRYKDPRLTEAVRHLKTLGVKKLRTGISWADFHRPNAMEWFDTQMEALRDFDVTVALSFTPPSRGRRPHHSSPPVAPEEFGSFARDVAHRYIKTNVDKVTESSTAA